MTTLGIDQLTDRELADRRQQLEALAQGLITNGMKVSEGDEAEYLAVRDEMDLRANRTDQG
jgi:hypothetical protein